MTDSSEVLCRKCGQPIEGEAFGSEETGYEHPFVCPVSRKEMDDYPTE